jgi:hypothetical protein
LHGCSLPVAHAAIRVALHEHHARFPPTGPSGLVDLVVITGRGVHSAERLQPVLRPEVQTLLVERFALSSWTAPGNQGRLVVDAAGIAAWAEQAQDTKAALMRRLSAAILASRPAAQRQPQGQ